MTANRDLKRRIRERQARTGESYVTARRHVIGNDDPEPAAPSPAIAVEEMQSLTEEAKQLGMKCRVTITSTLAARVDPVTLLTRIRDALKALPDDPAVAPLYSIVMRGELPADPPRIGRTHHGQVLRFITRASAGIAGISESGTMLALQVGDAMVVAHIGLRPLSNPITGTSIGKPQPRLVLTLLEGLLAGPDPAIAMMMR